MSIYYITYYEPSKLKKYSFEISPAGQQKAEYIIEQLSRTTSFSKVINLAESSKKRGIFPRIKISLFPNVDYVVWSGFGKPNRLARRLHYYFRRLQLKLFLNSLSEDDVVIAYHSLLTADIYSNTIRKKKYKLILELEEIYQDVVACSTKKAAWERKVINSANGFILSTKSLVKEIPKGNPYIICNGTYHIEPDLDVQFNDGKIHCVYAGTFDPKKGGAAAAVSSARHLSENYHIHILGFGTDEQTRNIQNYIKQIQKQTKCIVTYDGLKKGKDYISFLQKCHIGLCTQIPDAKYVNTSFPSKILVYLANGLRVLSVRIPAVEQSAVGDLLYYYDNQEPQEIAAAITQIDIAQHYDSREKIEALDCKFKNELRELLETI